MHGRTYQKNFEMIGKISTEKQERGLFRVGKFDMILAKDKSFLLVCAEGDTKGMRQKGVRRFSYCFADMVGTEHQKGERKERVLG